MVKKPDKKYWSYLKRLKLMLKAPERQNWCRYTFYNMMNLKLPHHHLDTLYSQTNMSGTSSQNWECKIESSFALFSLHINTCRTSVYITNCHFHPCRSCNPWSTMPTCVNICKISMISRKKNFQISFRMAVHTPNFSVTLEFLNEQSKISWLLMQKFH